MPKRFRDSNIWNNDWYINLSIEHKLLWQYIIDDCDCAGIWKPNIKRFEFSTDVKIDLEEFLMEITKESERIIVLENGRFLLPGFIFFQYGKRLKPEKNNAHLGIVRCLQDNLVKIESLWGPVEVIYESGADQFEVKMSPKEKEKDTEREKDLDREQEKKGIYRNKAPSAEIIFNGLSKEEKLRIDELSREIYQRTFEDLNEGKKNTVLKELYIES